MTSTPDAKRASARTRGYDRRWRQARAAFLAEPGNQLCRLCSNAGRITPATVVDHVVPHRGDPALFWDRANWQPLCKPHHDSDKQREERSRFARVDAEGWPVPLAQGGGCKSLRRDAPGPAGGAKPHRAAKFEQGVRWVC